MYTRTRAGGGVGIIRTRGQLVRTKPVTEKHLPRSRLGTYSDRRDGEKSLNNCLHRGCGESWSRQVHTEKFRDDP